MQQITLLELTLSEEKEIVKTRVHNDGSTQWIYRLLYSIVALCPFIFIIKKGTRHHGSFKFSYMTFQIAFFCYNSLYANDIY